jgi:predicted nucleic acid-binding protein
VDVYFFDSSALVKRYAQETGTAWAQTVTVRNYVFLARITQVEVIAAIERRKRTGTLAAADATAAIASFRTHLSTEYAMVDISKPLLNQAADLAEMHGLRAYDAVQLAAALQVEGERRAFKMSGLILVSADLALNAAAAAEGLAVEDPNNH